MLAQNDIRFLIAQDDRLRFGQRNLRAMRRGLGLRLLGAQAHLLVNVRPAGLDAFAMLGLDRAEG